VTAETVVEILDSLERAGVDAWVDGGWGVDALLGRETRPHDDLDLVVALAHVERIRAALGARSFALAEDQLPIRFVLAHPELGRVDFHSVSFDAEGGGLQPQPGGGTFRYPPEGFVTGTIAGRPVRCISADVQVLCHLGYEPREKDVHDVLALHRALGTRLPRSYERFLGDVS
jgi:lincosamide nucleotidyltransferase A/C/D/E